MHGMELGGRGYWCQAFTIATPSMLLLPCCTIQCYAIGRQCMPPQCYGQPIHAAYILQIPCSFDPYSCCPRPLAHPSALCAPYTIYPNTYPNIHYHYLPVPLAYLSTSCTSYTNNPSTYYKIYYHYLLVPSASVAMAQLIPVEPYLSSTGISQATATLPLAYPYPSLPQALHPTHLYCIIVYH